MVIIMESSKKKTYSGKYFWVELPQLKFIINN